MIAVTVRSATAEQTEKQRKNQYSYRSGSRTDQADTNSRSVQQRSFSFDRDNYERDGFGLSGPSDLSRHNQPAESNHFESADFQPVGLVSRNSLPIHVFKVFEDLEAKYNIKVSSENRIQYYQEFLGRASGQDGFEVMHSSEVEKAVTNLNFTFEPSELRLLMKRELDEAANLRQGGSFRGYPEYEHDMFDFTLFAAILGELSRVKARRSSMSPAVPVIKMLPLDPDSVGKQLWDCFCLLLLLYCSFSVPYGIAFVESTSGAVLTSLDIFDLLVDCMFMLDIALAFVTAYDNQGVMVKDFGSISQAYLKSWFIPDFAGSFPFDTVISAALVRTGSMNSTNFIRGLKFVRMLKLIRAVKFMNKLNKLKQQEGFEVFGPIIGIGSSMFLLVFTAHVLGCLFTLLIGVEPDQNWLVHYNPDLAQAESWIRYVTALYWAIISVTTMGYGDILPVTHAERLFVIAVALIGAIVFSFCMGNVASLISQVTSVDDRFQDKLRAVVEYLQFREISSETKRKVKSYYGLCWRRSPAPYRESEILYELPEALRNLVLQEIGTNTTVDLSFLQGFDEECIGYVSSRMSNYIYGPGDIIYCRADVATKMFFLVAGTVELRWGPHANDFSNKSQSNECTKKVVERGQIFGELAFFPDILGPLRPQTAVATSKVNLYALSSDIVQDLSQEYPEVVRRLRELCKYKAVECKAYDASLADPLQNKHKGTKPCKIELSIEKTKSEMVSLKESRVLIPAGGEGGSEVIKLLHPVISNCSNEEFDWKILSCVVSESGEVLCVEHSVDGLSADSPKSLGFLVPGRSTFKLLDPSETKRYVSQSKRALCGCTMRTFGRTLPEQKVMSRSSSEVGKPSKSSPFDQQSSGTQERQLQLFTWSQKDMDKLYIICSCWLNQKSPISCDREGEEEGTCDSTYNESQAGRIDSEAAQQKPSSCATPGLAKVMSAGEPIEGYREVNQDTVNTDLSIHSRETPLQNADALKKENEELQDRLHASEIQVLELLSQVSELRAQLSMVTQNTSSITQNHRHRSPPKSKEPRRRLQDALDTLCTPVRHDADVGREIENDGPGTSTGANQEIARIKKCLQAAMTSLETLADHHTEALEAPTKPVAMKILPDGSTRPVSATSRGPLRKGGPKEWESMWT